MNRFLFLSFIAITLIACNKEDDFVPKAEIDKQSLQFSQHRGIDSFTITSNVSWLIEKNAGWITLSETEGNSGKLIKVTVAENTTAALRTASITVKFEGIPEIKIDVTQSKALETAGLFILSEGAFPSASDISCYDMKTETLSKFSVLNGKTLGVGANDLAIYGSKLYCVVTGSADTEGHIEVINPATGMSIKRIDVKTEDGNNAQPRRIVFHENKAYVTTYSQSVIRLDTASLNIDNTAALSGMYAEGICCYEDKLYVCNSGQGNGNSISVINLGSFTEMETITVPLNPTMIEATASGEIYFVTADATWMPGGNPSNLHLLNLERKQVTRTFDIRASKIALAEDFIYAVATNWTDADYISKINIQTKAVADISSIFEEYAMVYGVSANPLNGDVYLTNTGQDVYVFDKDGNEKFNFKTGIAMTATVVPLIK
jgi:DNA-binding beta-propeller fold protein YncE